MDSVRSGWHWTAIRNGPVGRLERLHEVPGRARRPARRREPGREPRRQHALVVVAVHGQHAAAGVDRRQDPREPRPGHQPHRVGERRAAAPRRDPRARRGAGRATRPRTRSSPGARDRCRAPAGTSPPRPPTPRPRGRPDPAPSPSPRRPPRRTGRGRRPRRRSAAARPSRRRRTPARRRAPSRSSASTAAPCRVSASTYRRFLAAPSAGSAWRAGSATVTTIRGEGPAAVTCDQRTSRDRPN